jgi:hypothetical protein
MPDYHILEHHDGDNDWVQHVELNKGALIMKIVPSIAAITIIGSALLAGGQTRSALK